MTKEAKKNDKKSTIKKDNVSVKVENKKKPVENPPKHDFYRG